MPEFALIHRTALATARTGQFGATPAAVELIALPECGVLQAVAAQFAADSEATLHAAFKDMPVSIRRVSPYQSLVISDPNFQVDLDSIGNVLGTRITLLDQSHGYAPIQISGPNVEDMLAKGTGVDLSINQWPVGQSHQTLVGQTSALVTRTEPTKFELIVMRSFATNLWDELITMGLEFGITARNH